MHRRSPSHRLPSLLVAAALLALAACSSPAEPSSSGAQPGSAAAPASAAQNDPQAELLQQRLTQQQQTAAKNDGERMGYYAFGHAKDLVIALNAQPAEPPPELPAEKTPKRPGIKNVESAGPVGKIDQGAVAGIFRSQQSSLQSCYERGLKKNPSLKGKVQLMITIKADGKVGKVGVGSDTLRDGGVTTCMTSRVKSWVFPKPDGGQVTVAKTFVFAPQG